jgi:hypothetical protein
MEPLVLEKRYQCAMKYYMLEGKDGFDDLRTADTAMVIRSKAGQNLRATVSNYISDFHHRHNNADGDHCPRLSRQVSMRREVQSMLDRALPVHVSGHSGAPVVWGIAPTVEGRVHCCGS